MLTNVCFTLVTDCTLISPTVTFTAAASQTQMVLRDIIFPSTLRVGKHGKRTTLTEHVWICSQFSVDTSGPNLSRTLNPAQRSKTVYWQTAVLLQKPFVSDVFFYPVLFIQEKNEQRIQNMILSKNYFCMTHQPI